MEKSGFKMLFIFDSPNLGSEQCDSINYTVAIPTNCVVEIEFTGLQNETQIGFFVI